jgi:hypothetical protein
MLGIGNNPQANERVFPPGSGGVSSNIRAIPPAGHAEAALNTKLDKVACFERRQVTHSTITSILANPGFHHMPLLQRLAAQTPTQEREKPWPH